ncbi:Os03g0591300, partial [Oryza sativa Japonica Group]|uniref:Uncharacterized protein n=2 Tax=Oryza TaxID=4527 RepID=I1QDV4_ORYGL
IHPSIRLTSSPVPFHRPICFFYFCLLLIGVPSYHLQFPDNFGKRQGQDALGRDDVRSAGGVLPRHPVIDLVTGKAIGHRR